MPLAAAIPALVGVGTAVYSARQNAKATDKALNAQKDIAANLKYEPIDIEKLKREATEQAIANATQSLALERQLTPDIASARETYAREVRQDLERGGALSPDTINQVTQAGSVVGSTSGIGSSSTVPLTAALLGISSMNLRDQRLNRANNLIQGTDLPVTGLDPGTVASIEVANNAAFNDFNAAKAGVASNLANSEATARAAQIAGQTGTVSAAANALTSPAIQNLLRGMGSGIAGILNRNPALDGTNVNQNPILNPIIARGTTALA